MAGQIDRIFKNYTYKNEQHKSLVGILYLAANIETRIESILEPYGITLRQYRVLRQLRVINPGCVPVSDLKNYLINKNADASRLAERMTKAGLIEKGNFSRDKRVSQIRISRKGLDLINLIDQHDDEFLHPVNSIGKEATTVFIGHLETMLQTFEN